MTPPPEPARVDSFPCSLVPSWRVWPGDGFKRLCDWRICTPNREKDRGLLSSRLGKPPPSCLGKHSHATVHGMSCTISSDPIGLDGRVETAGGRRHTEMEDLINGLFLRSNTDDIDGLYTTLPFDDTVGPTSSRWRKIRSECHGVILDFPFPSFFALVSACVVLVSGIQVSPIYVQSMCTLLSSAFNSPRTCQVRVLTLGACSGRRYHFPTEEVTLMSCFPDYNMVVKM
ncbi:hypothetical protein V8F33_009585 [Rhypophila sp. PSN 637]